MSINTSQPQPGVPPGAGNSGKTNLVYITLKVFNRVTLALGIFKANFPNEVYSKINYSITFKYF